jgi:amidase
VRTAIGDFAEALTEAGAKVERDSPLLPDQADSARVYMHLLMATLGAGFPVEVYEHRRAAAAQLDPADTSLDAERTRGTVLSYRDWLAADGRRAVLRRRWSEFFAEFDVVVCPVMSTPAFPHDHSPMGGRTIGIDGVDHHYLDQLAFPGTATLPGLPATALPIGRSDDGLPIGVQAIGPMFGDRTTIRFAELAEREFGGFTPPPGY